MVLGPNTVLKGRWKLMKKIGQGAFGEIYSGADTQTQDPVAVKLERWDNKKAVLKMEVAVLKKLQHCQFACRYVHCGHFEDHNYLVMELLGDNLSELRRRRPGGRFSLWTTVRIGMQVIKAVEAIHELGYLHRDIKPSNFAMGLAPGRKDHCVMIDFGLTRKYRLPSGQIRPPRDIAGFRGTARYASINSHLSKELSRRDDLWSVLYVLIEFLTGQLPWRKLKDKEEIGLLKIHFNSAELVRDLPPPYLTFMQHLQSLDYHDRPDYDMLHRLLEELGGGVAEHTAYDWESDGPGMKSPGGVGGDLNNSSYGSVRRLDTPGRDVSTNEQQLSQLEDRPGDGMSFQDDGTRGVADGSSSLVTPRHSAKQNSRTESADKRRTRDSARKEKNRISQQPQLAQWQAPPNAPNGGEDQISKSSANASQQSTRANTNGLEETVEKTAQQRLEEIKLEDQKKVAAEREKELEKEREREREKLEREKEERRQKEKEEEEQKREAERKERERQAEEAAKALVPPMEPAEVKNQVTSKPAKVEPGQTTAEASASVAKAKDQTPEKEAPPPPAVKQGCRCVIM